LKGNKRLQKCGGLRKLEAERAERKPLLDECKAEWSEQAAHKITNEDIGRAVNADLNDLRTLVQKWRVCDRRYEGYRARFLKLFREKPYLNPEWRQAQGLVKGASREVPCKLTPQA
jgi:hypothetical protein